MHSIIASVVRITSFDVPENCNGMITRKNVAGNHLFIVDHRRRCYLMKINSTQHFVQEKRTGKTDQEECQLAYVDIFEENVKDIEYFFLIK